MIDPILERLFDIKYSNITYKELLEYSKYVIITDKKRIFYGYSLMLLPKFNKHPEIFILSNTFDFFLIDGRGFYLLLKLFGRNPKNHISIPDFAKILLEIANELKLKVFLLGSTEENNKKAIYNIRKDYPSIISVDGYNGYFSDQEETDIVNMINNFNPDILLIGISSPKKEKFAYTRRENLSAKIILPCGGVIDQLAGKTKREPKIIKKLGLTWFFRFIQEPKRLFNTMVTGFIKIIFILLPSIFVNVTILKKEFSIPKFYGIKK